MAAVLDCLLNQQAYKLFFLKWKGAPAKRYDRSFNGFWDDTGNER